MCNLLKIHIFRERNYFVFEFICINTRHAIVFPIKSNTKLLIELRKENSVEIAHPNILYYLTAIEEFKWFLQEFWIENRKHLYVQLRKNKNTLSIWSSCLPSTIIKTTRRMKQDLIDLSNFQQISERLKTKTQKILLLPKTKLRWPIKWRLFLEFVLERYHWWRRSFWN
jgi:hypothetical protein